MPAIYTYFRQSSSLLIIVFSGVVLVAFFAPVTPGLGQDTPQTAFPETVVNLASGRVFIVVAKGAILIGTVENPIEADTHLPIPVQIDSSRVGVLMGAVEWIALESRQQLARLDQELPHLRGHEAPTAPHLSSEVGREAVDIEAVGDGVFNRLNELARNLHGKIDLPANDPIAVLITADYVSNYGPEIWRIDYKFEQSEESLDYWTTRVQRPNYTQCWPPEKGQLRTLLMFSYPPDKSGCPAPALRSLPDGIPREASGAILNGDTSQLPVADATQFFRATLDAIAPRGARETIGTIGEESGFAWILPPPAETMKPNLKSAHPAGAPSLAAPPLHSPSSDQ